MLLIDLVRTSDEVGATRSRREKVARLARLLAAAPPLDAAPAVAFLSGELNRRQIGVGWAALRDVIPEAAGEATLTVAGTDAALGRLGALAGPGCQAARRAALEDLLARATAPEQRWLRALMAGELRQGALRGVMIEAVAAAARVPDADVRRALMLAGDLGAVAAAALQGGAPRLAAFRLTLGRPLEPMLAAPAPGIAEALARTGPAAVELKLDGARVQLHRRGDEVAVFTRTGDDVTPRVPELVEAALALPVDAAVLDGEAIALRPGGRPHPFQVTGARLASRRDVAALRERVPLSALLFDVLHAEGDDLLDRPARERHAILARLVPEALRVPRVVVADAPAGELALADALRRGHEGVVVKALDAPYAAGRRGAGWIKVKPHHTLDLVVLAAEWGHGRRRGRLSNLHLGARHEQGMVMLGKTFKGLTDAMLAWQTERLLALETAREGHVVHVRPELVVEVAFDGVQTSPRYPGGVALRFARVVRHRPDKPASQADTLATVLALHRGDARSSPS